MKNFILTIMAFFAMTISSFAQNQSNYAGSSKFADNMSVGINGGIQTNLHDWTAPQGAVVNIDLNKEISPLFGLTVEIGTGINNRYNWYPNVGHVCNGTIFDQLTTFVDGRFNISNAICGFNPNKRLFEVETITGVGYGHGYANGGDNGVDALLVKGGLRFNFNVTNAITFNITPCVVYNVSQTGQFDSRYAVGQVTTGMTYHFRTSNGTRTFAKAKLYDFNEANALNDAINSLKSENDALKNKLTQMARTAKNTAKPEAIVVTKERTVSFTQGSFELSDDAKVILDTFKPGTTVNVAGSTSPEGSTEVNTKLAIDRANEVAKYLSDKGVKVAKTTGGESGRVAIIYVVDED